MILQIADTCARFSIHPVGDVQRVPAPHHCLRLFVPAKWSTVDGHGESDLHAQ
jgi:hypothetical protein